MGFSGEERLDERPAVYGWLRKVGHRIIIRRRLPADPP
jgi:hypothetical protein